MREHSFQSHDGLRLPVRVLGTGPPLVVVPGWLGAYTDWYPVVQRLARDRTCYVWEARPYFDPKVTGIDALAADLRALIQAFDLQAPLVLGHSMGALTCWEYVRQFGCDGIGRFCLVDQSPRLLTDADWSLGLFGSFSEAENQVFIEQLRRDFVGTTMAFITRGRQVEPGSGAARLEAMFRETRRQRLEALDPEPWVRCWEHFSRRDYRAEVERVEVPTLLVFGARSFYGLDVARYVHRHTPGSRLRVHALAGHSPHQDDLPGFLENVRVFAGD
ncbi:alpha/beta hydrolase [Aquisalimonas sp.]|uniref:alpha/beta fold hydrolase n=1 Tax=unclassified Aquisalimonas TaxID=2644645 RepID=UPI0025C4419C|nr:alpha/beta hydrolase [Aquisalimonas sp.]